ncbi:MAG: hypothetical protein QNJ70_05005 [Xenococcaceae cyanobacterium MO_207.B15]|nr:hypothetical protein [Xenococcaceae cyanobacterium MO_207.B15]
MNFNSQLISKLASLNHNQFTGIVTITTNNSQSWNIYLYLGQLLWTESSIHRNRFWQRNLSKLCPQVTTTQHKFERVKNNDISDYYLINTLRENKLVSREKLLKLINCSAIDTFFEILQNEAKAKIDFTIQEQQPLFLLKSGFNLSLTPSETPKLLKEAEGQWVNWTNKGLASCSPNLAPLLKNYQELKKQLSPIIFQNMLRLLDGKSTLRDLAIKMDKDVLEVANGLMPYFFKGYLRLLEIPDIPKIYLKIQQ